MAPSKISTFSLSASRNCIKPVPAVDYSFIAYIHGSDQSILATAKHRQRPKPGAAAALSNPTECYAPKLHGAQGSYFSRAYPARRTSFCPSSLAQKSTNLFTDGFASASTNRMSGRLNG